MRFLFSGRWKNETGLLGADRILKALQMVEKGDSVVTMERTTLWKCEESSTWCLLGLSVPNTNYGTFMNFRFDTRLAKVRGPKDAGWLAQFFAPAPRAWAARRHRRAMFRWHCKDQCRKNNPEPCEDHRTWGGIC